MPIFSAIVLYSSLWFLSLFLVLPFGQTSQEDVGKVTPGTPRGAPYKHRLGLKMILATGIACVAWGVLYWVITSGIVTRADMMEFDLRFRN